MTQLVLSLFPGIGLLDMAFEEQGFCVVRGPDLLWGGDVKRFHPPAGKFDGIIGGPPCQFASRLRHMVKQVHGESAIAENLIPEYERIVSEACPTWFLMENVPDAPLPVVAGYQVKAILFNNRWALAEPNNGIGPEQNRLRRFSFGTRDGRELRPEIAPLMNATYEYADAASGGRRAVHVALARFGNGELKRKKSAMRNLGYISRTGFERACRLQGLPEDFLKDAPFTVAGKQKVVGNGVPLPLGRTIAKAVKAALGIEL